MMGMFLRVFTSFLKAIFLIFRKSARLLLNLNVRPMVFMLGKAMRDVTIAINNNVNAPVKLDVNSLDYVGYYNKAELVKLAKRSLNLSERLQREYPVRFSILMPVFKPALPFFKEAVEACVGQGAFNLELLIGFDGPHGNEYSEYLTTLQQQQTRVIIKFFHFNRTNESAGISSTTNQLAEKATGDYLILMDHDDWIRPDLIVRYHQVLLAMQRTKNLVLYCNEFKINEANQLIPGSTFRKPQHPEFPYLFVNSICHCLMVSKELWGKVGGLRREYDGAQDYDLCLRLDLVGARFENVPFEMYAWRAHAKSTAKSSGQKSYAHVAGKKALADYLKARGLDWEVVDGYYDTQYAANPKIARRKVQVVVPFKDEAALTIECARRVLNQEYDKIQITFVDNCSEDQTIRDRLVSLGIEVLEFKGPFNFSEINNYAVTNSRHAGAVDVILFLNNDVFLKDNAIAEMLKWIEQPGIGIVGARLHYEDKTIQHGGIDVLPGPNHIIPWCHTDLRLSFEQAGFARITRVCEAVTGACLMIKKETFDRVQGFDEIFYPIAFSDTDLCRKVRDMGLKCLYVANAEGIHFESKTRGYSIIEDFEGSSWLYKNLEGNRKAKQSFLDNHLID